MQIYPKLEKFTTFYTLNIYLQYLKNAMSTCVQTGLWKKRPTLKKKYQPPWQLSKQLRTVWPLNVHVIGETILI